MPRMVERAARATTEADRVVTEAEERAREMRTEAEDYVDRKLAAFEVVLDRTMQTVQKGRERLQVHAPTPPAETEILEDDGAFFDQDDL